MARAETTTPRASKHTDKNVLFLRYPDKVTREYKVIITTNIYYEDISVGKASGKFLVTYLRSRHKDTQNFLTALVKFAFWKEVSQKNMCII